MKYIGMPMGMWMLFKKSFQNHLVSVLNMDPKEAETVASKAKVKYKKIIRKLPEFEKEDRFKMNIVNCAMLSGFLLSMDPIPTLSQVTEYYEKSMMTSPMKWFCRISGKKKFTDRDIQTMKRTAVFKAADRNPYSWNMDFYPYKDESGYEARFTKCGICTLMKEVGLFAYVPAMCHLDYSMSDAGKASRFVREYTLASGGPYCDCGYKKRNTK